MNMKCKFCFKDKKPVDAHIIPRCFFETMRIRGDNRSFQLLSNTKNEHPRKSRIGLYDNNILCKECENIFHDYDDYACKTLLSDIDKYDHILNPHNEKEIGYKLDNINYKILKLFFISVLWRASVSEKKEFSAVNCISDLFKDRLKEMIRNSNPGDANDFLVIVRKFTDNLGKNFLMDPYKLQIKKINFYRFYLGGGYEFNIKVDETILEESDVLYAFSLKPENTFYVLFRDNLISSKEFPILKDILNKPENSQL